MAAKIPVIDLSSPNASAELLNAAATFGFIFIKHNNTVLPTEHIAKAFQLCQNFFHSSDQDKTGGAVYSPVSGQNHGFIAMKQETLDAGNQKQGDFKECFNMGEFVDGKPQHGLPTIFCEAVDFLATFSSECHTLCNQIMDKLAIALEIEAADGAQWFSKRHDQSVSPSGSILRFLHYPKLPPSTVHDPSEDIRAGAHTDYGSVTLLFRLPGQPGLEIRTPSGEWASVPVGPETDDLNAELPILVNIADMLSFWTNGLLKSVMHRVVFPSPGEGIYGGEERFTIAYFCHPQDDTELVEIPSKFIRDRQSTSVPGPATHTRTLTAKQHLTNRLAAAWETKA